MPVLGDVVKRVQRLLDDKKGQWAKDQDVIDYAQNEYEAIYNKIPTSLQNSEMKVELPNILAGLPNLDDFQNPANQNPVLVDLVTPRYIEWKLPGQDPSLYRLAVGPVDEIVDLTTGVPALAQWAWTRQSIKLSRYSVNLDLRITGDFMFGTLSDMNSVVQMYRNLTPVLAYRVAAIMAMAHTKNQVWITNYPKMAEDAFDDVLIELVKQNQGKIRRVGSINRSTQNSGFAYSNR